MDQLGGGGGDEGSYGEADGGEAEGFAEDAVLQGSGRGAESHADADFLFALADGVRDDGVDTEGGEDQGEGGEAGEQVDDEAPWGDGAIDQLFQAFKLLAGHFGVERKQGVADGGSKCGGVEAGAED